MARYIDEGMALDRKDVLAGILPNGLPARSYKLTSPRRKGVNSHVN